MRSRIVQTVTVTALTAVCLGLAVWSHAAEPGDTKEVAALKARATAPKDSELDLSASIAALLTKKGPADWSMAKGAAVDGYVVQVEKEEDGDIHVVLAAKAGETSTTRWVIAEVTTSWQAMSPALSEKSLRAMYGQKVRVTGWLFYDTDPDPDPRGTLWEIHPVTSIAVLGK